MVDRSLLSWYVNDAAAGSPEAGREGGWEGSGGAAEEGEEARGEANGVD